MNTLSQIESRSQASQRSTAPVAPVVDTLFDRVLPIVPGLIARLERGIDVLDIGRGTARALTDLAFTYPQSRFTGVDLSAEAISAARAEAGRFGLDNVVFEVRDIADVFAPKAYDLVTASDVIHARAEPERLLRSIRQSLRTGGVFLIREPRFAGHRHRGAAGGDDLACQMLRRAGFGQITVKSLPHDPIHFYYVMPV